jgi:hypothetical protein
MSKQRRIKLEWFHPYDAKPQVMATTLDPAPWETGVISGYGSDVNSAVDDLLCKIEKRDK